MRLLARGGQLRGQNVARNVASVHSTRAHAHSAVERTATATKRRVWRVTRRRRQPDQARTSLGPNRLPEPSAWAWLRPALMPPVCEQIFHVRSMVSTRPAAFWWRRHQAGGKRVAAGLERVMAQNTNAPWRTNTSCGASASTDAVLREQICWPDLNMEPLSCPCHSRVATGSRPSAPPASARWYWQAPILRCSCPR